MMDSAQKKKASGSKLSTDSGTDTGKHSHGHKTRGATRQNEREKFLQMSLEDKRSLYKCGENYVTPDNVPTWTKYYKSRAEKIRRKPQKPDQNKRRSKVYTVDPALSDKVSMWRGDITTLEIDGIVNAANNSLMGGGGVDGAIHSAAGASLLRAECSALNGCDTGDAKITSGYKLPAKNILHTVGPIGEHTHQLQGCYSKCLSIMHDHTLKTIAFPCISTGIYGYPNDRACSVALRTCREWLEHEENSKLVDRIIFCLFLPVDVSLYEEMMQIYFPVEEPPVAEVTKDEEKEAETEVEEAGKEQPSDKKSAEDTNAAVDDAASPGTGTDTANAEKSEGDTTAADMSVADESAPSTTEAGTDTANAEKSAEGGDTKPAEASVADAAVSPSTEAGTDTSAKVKAQEPAKLEAETELTPPTAEAEETAAPGTPSQATGKDPMAEEPAKPESKAEAEVPTGEAEPKAEDKPASNVPSETTGDEPMDIGTKETDEPIFFLYK